MFLSKSSGFSCWKEQQFFQLLGFLVHQPNLKLFNLSALCIHVSPECKEVLVQLGGYILAERGFVEMKVGGNFNNFASLFVNSLLFVYSLMPETSD